MNGDCRLKSITKYGTVTKEIAVDVTVFAILGILILALNLGSLYVAYYMSGLNGIAAIVCIYKAVSYNGAQEIKHVLLALSVLLTGRSMLYYIAAGDFIPLSDRIVIWRMLDVCLILLVVIVAVRLCKKGR